MQHSCYVFVLLILKSPCVIQTVMGSPAQKNSDPQWPCKTFEKSEALTPQFHPWQASQQDRRVSSVSVLKCLGFLAPAVAASNRVETGRALDLRKNTIKWSTDQD